MIERITLSHPAAPFEADMRPAPPEPRSQFQAASGGRDRAWRRDVEKHRHRTMMVLPMRMHQCIGSPLRDEACVPHAEGSIAERGWSGGPSCPVPHRTRIPMRALAVGRSGRDRFGLS